MAKFLTDAELVLAANGKLAITCQHLHVGSCLTYWLKCLIHSAKFSLKFYVPLNIVSILVKYKALLSKPKTVIISAIKACIRSSAVLVGMVLFAKMTICGYVRATHNAQDLAMLCASLSVMPASLIESYSKISDLSLYVMPRFFDAIWKFLSRRNLVKDIPYFKVLLFAMSISALSYATYREEDIIKPMNSTLMKKFFGVN